MTDDDLDQLIRDLKLGQPRAVRGPGARAACGTASGYRRHRANGESPCAACHQANTETQREHYHQGVKAPERLKQIAHGTLKGYKQHRYRKEQACTMCLEAARADSAARARTRRAKGNTQ
ncbi:hypothetical protein [Streptomyces sp. NPDC051173]|uniref:hypothetical protein n=1 Tax=Streptomyces sp. NPDC051173 TaxID=3155164 RepID=UPI00344BA5DD